VLKNILLLLFFTISIFSLNLDAKIEALYKAPKEQRYKIMNEIKMELIKLNQSQREMFVEKLLRHQNIKNENQTFKTVNFKKNQEYHNITEAKTKQHLHKNKHKQNKNKQNKNKHHNK